MAVRWKVREFLEEHNLTPYRLMVSSGLAKGTVYRLVNDNSTGISPETLNSILSALTELTGQPVGITEVLEFTPDSERR